MENLLIIDDSLEFLEDVEVILKDRYKIIKSNTAKHGLEILQSSRISAILLDLQLPDIHGLEVLKIIREEIDPYVPVIIISEFDDTDNVVQAMKNGAYDFLSKDFNLELLSAKIEKALKHRSLEIGVSALRKNIDESRDKFIFASDTMKKINFEITRIAKLNFDVLLYGETGVGKDMIAYQIYERSNRVKYPFITVPLRNLGENVVESELFGHEKGAFTGAVQSRVGFFEAANGGIIYIPEISSLNEALQLKLLHFMQYKNITRMGQDPRKGAINLDVRLIMASNENLDTLVESGKIREDFYYRISGVKLYIPPLRERKDDIEELIKYFLEKYTGSDKERKYSFDSESLNYLKEYEWHGNVRELANSVKNAITYANNYELNKNDFPCLNRIKKMKNKNTFDIGNDNDFPTLEAAEKEFKKSYFSKLLVKTENKISSAAKIAGITPQGFRKALKQLDIE
jgi:DNA-binding NtrC family response regulator